MTKLTTHASQRSGFWLSHSGSGAKIKWLPQRIERITGDLVKCSLIPNGCAGLCRSFEVRLGCLTVNIRGKSSGYPHGLGDELDWMVAIGPKDPSHQRQRLCRSSCATKSFDGKQFNSYQQILVRRPFGFRNGIQSQRDSFLDLASSEQPLSSR